MKKITNMGLPDQSAGFAKERKAWKLSSVCREKQAEIAALKSSLAAAEALNGRLREALLEIRTNSKLRKRGGAGGRDSYAGMLGVIRVIDAALALPADAARGKEGQP